MSRPLVVDLDGAVLRSDILAEAVLRYMTNGMRAVFQLPLWLLKGKVVLKQELARRVSLDVGVLPYNEEVIAFVRDAKKENRPVVLATASHRLYAEQIAGHFDLFDRVMATDEQDMLSSRSKYTKLIEEFGEKGFDYIGNSHADLPLWKASDRAYLADPEPGVRRKAEQFGNVERVFHSRKSRVQMLLRGMRPHQWLKNLLLFIPLLAAHQFTNVALILQSLLAFLFFSLGASGGYLFNDLLDIDHDRHHPRKRHRPLASGALPLQIGGLAAPLLAGFSLAGSLLLMPAGFTVALVIYSCMTILYSHYLKRIIGVDTIVLAALYTVRIIAGSYACGLIPTFWILAFSMFLFLSLAFVKRYAELFDVRENGETDIVRGRGYFPSDLEVVANLGTAAGYLSVLVLALYIQDSRTLQLYRTHELIWLACPILLFWISRIWMIAHRGEMHDDPVVFAVRDRVSLLCGAMFGAVFVMAMLL